MIDTPHLDLTATVFDNRHCELGEGAFWHPLREQFFWFDILGHRLLTRDADEAREWRFDRAVSAAGWIDRDSLLIAGAGALLRFELEIGCIETLAQLDDGNGRLRSNDGRTDPWGGFWISTMGYHAEPRCGAIWRYWRGEMRQLFGGLTIPNAICFAPDGGHAIFTDTAGGIVFRQRLSSADGWPSGEAKPFLDLRAEGLHPDGAVIDTDGRLWLAQWGAGRVAVYDRQGQFEGAVRVAAPYVSCPSLGGVDLSVLFVTSALEGMEAEARIAAPEAGMTFHCPVGCRGQAEHRFKL